MEAWGSAAGGEVLGERGNEGGGVGERTCGGGRDVLPEEMQGAEVLHEIWI